MRETVIKWAYEHKIVAIVRGIEPEKCLKVAEALYEGGIRMMEITYDQKNPDSWEETANTIGKLAKAMEGKMLIGAGTVTNVKLVELTHKAGGLFIISPDTKADVIRRTRELGLVSMPGALTPTDVTTAWDAGADIIKLFPANEVGLSYIKAIKAPLKHIPLMATGGVRPANAMDYLNAGSAALGVGGDLVNKQWIAAGEFDKIGQAARDFADSVKGA